MSEFPFCRNVSRTKTLVPLQKPEQLAQAGKDNSGEKATQVVVDLIAAPLPKPAADTAEVLDLDMTY